VHCKCCIQTSQRVLTTLRLARYSVQSVLVSLARDDHFKKRVAVPITRKQLLLLITSMQLALFAHARVQRLHYKRESHGSVKVAFPDVRAGSLGHQHDADE